jgi:hypothetical protein
MKHFFKFELRRPTTIISFLGLSKAYLEAILLDTLDTWLKGLSHVFLQMSLERVRFLLYPLTQSGSLFHFSTALTEKDCLRISVLSIELTQNFREKNFEIMTKTKQF